MGNIRRCLTASEWKAVRDALPHRLRPIMDDIDRVDETCWNCEHQHDRFCKLHGEQIPMEWMNVVQENCGFKQCLTPF